MFQLICTTTNPSQPVPLRVDPSSKEIQRLAEELAKEIGGIEHSSEFKIACDQLGLQPKTLTPTSLLMIEFDDATGVPLDQEILYLFE